ncbi:MAG: diaminopimelate epimerase [Gemmatimonadales bacterium]
MRPGSVFYKMSGSGNDFLMFDGRYSPRDEFTPEAIRAICDRRQGAGADGVIMLDPAAPKGAHFTFHFWNSDGSAGSMCGNGALCATRLASLIELAPSEGEVVFATPAGLHTGQVREGRPTIHLPDCDLPTPLPKANVEPSERAPHFGNTGVPHLVLMVDDVATVELERRGPPLRRDPATGADGANVNWVSPAPGGGFRMRTWERGVEGETLACGTGAVACALVVGTLGLGKSPVRLWTRSTLPLDVAWTASGRKAQSVTLSGEGRLVFRGIVGEPARQ